LITGKRQKVGPGITKVEFTQLFSNLLPKELNLQLEGKQIMLNDNAVLVQGSAYIHFLLDMIETMQLGWRIKAGYVMSSSKQSDRN
jgi:hypothetical protein